MGKGDRRSKRGKVWRGTHGKFRPRKKIVKFKKIESALKTEKKETVEEK